MTAAELNSRIDSNIRVVSVLDMIDKRLKTTQQSVLDKIDKRLKTAKETYTMIDIECEIFYHFPGLGYCV